jgi:hypothetical protein
MKRFLVICVAVLAMVSSGGCLRKETRQTLYLSSSGVVWSVLEQDVRSDEAAPDQRIAEEQDYFLSATAGTHPVARALRRLGAQSVQTTWLRNERPFSVMTTAHFAGATQLAQAILHDAQVRGDASLVRTGCQTTLTVSIDLGSIGDATDDSALRELLMAPADYRIVLTEGRFISADGFEIQDDGAVAIPDGKSAKDGVLTLSLSWSDEGCAERVSHSAVDIQDSAFAVQHSTFSIQHFVSAPPRSS